MKKYLNEIELSGIILLAIGVGIALFAGYNYGMWPCLLGMFLWAIVVVYKACNWSEYAAENKRNITIMLLAIVLIFLQMLWKN